MTIPVNNSSLAAAPSLPTGNATTAQPVDPNIEKTNQVGQQVLPAVQTDTTRCWSCKRKVGLLGFKCKCSYVFCGSHRHSDQHGCTYDYKTEFKQKLAKENPVVIASKVPPI
jgi:hypothetical protein